LQKERDVKDGNFGSTEDVRLQSAANESRVQEPPGKQPPESGQNRKDRDMNTCSICGKPATCQAFGGPVMQTADSVGSVMDRPYPENKEYRCKECKNLPGRNFDKPWGWRLLQTE